MQEFRVTLSDGTPALVRPIRPSDAPSLQRGLQRLSPQGLAYRFLQSRTRFSEKELHYLTHCDQKDHLAYILALLDEFGQERDAVGVTRCFRDKNDPALAEVAIVLVDEWQRHNGGTLLLRGLAQAAWKNGIHQWLALSYLDNLAAPRLLSRVSELISERRLGQGMLETIWQLHPPSEEAAT